MGQFERKIIDKVSGWLTVYEDGLVDRSWTGPAEFKFISDPVPPHHDFIDGVEVKDLTVDPNSGLRVRIYVPENHTHDKTKLPILLHYHGGGFCISQPDWYMYYTVYTRLACAARAIIVSPYLPLAPEHRLPAACNTGLEALLWLRSLALGQGSEAWLSAELADFDKIFLIGDSSGGNIVHNVALWAGEHDLSPLRLAGAVPIHPGFVRSERSRSELENPETPILTLEMVDKFLKMALPVGSTKDHPITCPMGEAAAPLEGLNLPPYLCCVAENDLIKDTQMEFYEAMKKGNKDVVLHSSYGVGHCFYLNKIAVDSDANTADQTEKLLKGIMEFINKH